MLVKNRTTKKEFQLMQKVLLKVKRLYMAEKAQLFPDTPVDQLQLTDDDQVPLELLDKVLSQERNKFGNRQAVVTELIA